MDKDVYSDETLKQYLLGEISDDEGDRIEQRYLADKDFFDQLLAVEDDLMDEYVGTELSPEDRQRFEQKLLATPKQREKLQQAQNFQESMRSHKSHRTRAKETESAKTSSWFSIFGYRIPAMAGALALLLLTLGIAWLLVRERQLNAALQRLQWERATMQQREQELQSKLEDKERQNSELIEQLQNVPPTEPSKQSPLTPTTATFVLTFTSTRGGGEASSFTLKRDIEMVQLEAPLANAEYNSYRAELQSADGTSLLKIPKLKVRKTAQGNAVLLRISSGLLKGRDYVLKISGVDTNGQLEDAGFYSFRIVRN
jgi:hypothetical protein